MLLRDVTDDDLPSFFEHQRDPDATRMAAFVSRDWAAFLLHWRTKVLGDASVQKKTIVVDGAVVGHVDSWNDEGRRVLGYWLAKEAWGRGLATAAVTEYLAHDPVRPLFAFVATHNRGSMRVLEKCGFHREGGVVVASDGVEEFHFRRDE